MERRWINLQQVAAQHGISLAEATALVDREHWPKLFRLHETLVLAPRVIARD